MVSFAAGWEAEDTVPAPVGHFLSAVSPSVRIRVVPEVAGASWNNVVARGARVRVLCPRFDEIKRSAHSSPDPRDCTATASARGRHRSAQSPR